MKDLYQILFEQLAENGIESFETLPTGVRDLGSNDYPWIKETLKISRNILRAGLMEMEKIGPTLTFGHHPRQTQSKYCVRQGSSLNVSYLERRARYSCLLPGRPIHIAGALRQYHSGSENSTEDAIYTEFLQQLFLLKPLLLNELARLIPCRYVDYYSPFGYGSTKETVSDLDLDSTIDIYTEADIDHMSVSKDPQAYLITPALEYAGCLSPIIDSIDLERYVDLVGSHEAEFDRHRTVFQRILSDNCQRSFKSMPFSVVKSGPHSFIL